MKKLLFVAGVGCASLVWTGAYARQATGNPAMQSPGAPEADIQEVVVTARRRAEALQEVPVAVTALSGSELVERSVRDIADIAQAVPNLKIGLGNRNAATAVVNIRGQENTGQGAFNSDPAVGIYFDEVYVARSAGALASSLVDMGSVQVLRGPQGTLFGRNNTGGAILLTPNRPTLTELSGSANVSYGSFGRTDFGGVVNVPVVTDQLGIRGSFLGNRGNGIGRSIITGIDTYGDRHRDAGRVSVRWRPDRRVTFDLTYDFTNIDETGPLIRAANTNSDTGTDKTLGYYQTRAGMLNVYSRVNIDGYTFRGEFEINPDLTFKTIVGRRLLKTEIRADVDGGIATSIDNLAFQNQSQWSGEAQLSGTVFRNIVSWINSVEFTGGGYYYYETGLDGSQLPDTTIPLVTGRTSQSFVTNRSAAGYLQIETSHFDKFFVTLGARYTQDDRDLRIRGVLNGRCSLLALPAATPVGVCFQSANAGFNYWSYAVGARYELGDHANLYAKYDKGQRSGGLDDSPTTIDPFVPEVLGSFEVGAKLELFERRVTTNVALFSAQVTNLQRSVRLLDPSGSPYTSVFNAAKGSVKGVEVEANVRPASGLMLAASLGLIDDDYKVFLDRTNGADLSNRKFPSTADVTYSLSASYEAVLTNATEFMIRADYSYRSKEFFETFNNALASQKAYGVLNARAHINFVGLVSGVDLTIAVYGKNLTNKKYLVYGSNSGIIPTDQPRSYGIELRAAF